MEDGLEDEAILAWLEEAKKQLPVGLARQVQGHVTKSWRAYSFDVWTLSSKATLDVMWHLVRVCHFPLYIGSEGEATATPTSTMMKDSVPYSAPVMQVELLTGGELMYSSSRT